MKRLIPSTDGEGHDPAGRLMPRSADAAADARQEEARSPAAQRQSRAIRVEGQMTLTPRDGLQPSCSAHADRGARDESIGR